MPQASSKTKSNKIRVETQLDSPQSRVECTGVISTNAASSPLWKNDPAVQEAGTKLIAAGNALSAAMNAAKALSNQATAANSFVTTVMGQFDAVLAVYKAHVERVSATPNDAVSLGMVVHFKSKYALAAPRKVDAWYDVTTSLLQIRVKQAPGMKACIVEVSADPTDPASWKQLPGVGAYQSLKGYAPGTYWVRAASARASGRSEFTEPVPVIVK